MTKTTNPTTTCEKHDLAKVLGIASKATAPRSTLPILGNVLLTANAQSGLLTVSGTNLEMSMTAWTEAQTTEQWSLTVPAKTFVDVVGALPDEAVTLEYVSRTYSLAIRSGTFESTLKGMAPEEYPLTQTVPADSPSVNAAAIRSALNRVAFAAATDDSRPVLAGVLFQYDQAAKQLEFAAADGFRLATAKVAVEADLTPLAGGVIVPGRVCRQLLDLLTESETTAVFMSQTQIGFRCGQMEIVMQLIEGKFPDFSNLVPKRSSVKVVASTDALRRACKAADIFARDNSRTMRVKVVGSDDSKKDDGQRIELSATSADMGAHKSLVAASVRGGPLEIAFNCRYLLDALNVACAEQAQLAMNGSADPAIVSAPGDDSWKCLIMPMHLGK